jgi:hypothetical protein
MDVRGRGNATRILHEFTDTFDINGVFCGQQMTQHVGHRVLTFLGGKLQNLHVPFVRNAFRMSRSQIVPRHPKAAAGKHLFAVSVVGERPRLSHERIDDVPIVDRRQMLADQPRHRLNQMSVMSHRNRFGTDAQIDQLPDQPTGDRVGIRPHQNRAAGADSYAPDDVVCVQTLIRQSIQMGLIFPIRFPSMVVGSSDEVFHKSDVFFTTVEAPTSPQQQFLVDAIFQMSVQRFDVAVLVGTAGIRAFGLTVVVTHQGRVALRQFMTARMVPHGRGQGVAAMPLRYATKLPERLLNAGTECLERFRKTEAHAFDIAVRQHAVKERVIESLPANLHAQAIADREVTGGQSTRMMILAEENRLPRTVQTSPPADTPLKRTLRGIRKLACVSPLQPLEQRLRLQPRFHLQPPLNIAPHIPERIAAGPIRAFRFPLRRQCLTIPILPRGLFVHFRHPC